MRPLTVAIVGAVGIVIAHLLDPWVFRQVRIENIYSEDWGRLLRVLGYLPLWLVLAFALWLQEVPRGWRRPAALAMSPVIAGIAGELLKLLLRRERPGAHEGLYYFRPFSERTFSTSGLALPSSHAVVAFGAAAILSRLFPRAWIIWWALAWGCAFTRVAAGAHFLSDVIVSALVGWLAGWLTWRIVLATRFTPRRRQTERPRDTGFPR
ncbi:MAG: phosphatase PAP2 family protein [Gemmatimonadota bacterium]